VFFFAAATWTFGQALTIDYFDGMVELKTTKGWSPLSIGDQVASNASIRVSQSGSVELSLGKQRITILKDGTYAVSDLLKAGQKGSKSGLGIALTQKLHSLTTDKASGTAAGGVRGAQQDNENLVWVDESEETRQKATQLFESGNYADAIPLLDKAISDATSAEERQELNYLLASAYYGTGETARAYRAVSKANPAADVEYYPDLMLLKAQIFLDSAAYKDGISVVDALLAAKPSPSYTQAAYLLSAQCSRGLGDEKGAKSALNTGYAIDPQSDMAKLISDMLKM
jgi:tetratricopeptide (TPR) repeat protein